MADNLEETIGFEKTSEVSNLPTFAEKAKRNQEFEAIVATLSPGEKLIPSRLKALPMAEFVWEGIPRLVVLGSC